jgi:membrane fusion protein (multidrug efflux system)
MVFTVSPDNKLAPRPVQLDGWTKGLWIVTKGLKSGDRVLVDGFIKAHEPGMVVTPVALSDEAATAAQDAGPEPAPGEAPPQSGSAKGTPEKSTNKSTNASSGASETNQAH